MHAQRDTDGAFRIQYRPAGHGGCSGGHSNVVGKPAAIMLLNRNATVKICHVFTKYLKSHTKEADILIVATGVRD